MNKKLLTVAVSAALVGAMGVANADVKINGTINGSLDYIKGKNAAGTDNSNRLNVSSNASNVVLSANEDLGGGLSGVFSWQEFVRMDNNNGGNGALIGGNTFLGLKGDTWGMVALGNNDSGAKQNGRAFDLFGNQIGDSRNLDMNNNRLPNLVFYTSPNFAGLNLMAGYSTNQDTGAANDSATAASGTKATTLMAKYTMGSLLVGVGYDKMSPGTGNGDKWLNAGAKYGLPSGTDLVAVYQKHSDIGGTTANGKTIGFGVAQKFGAETVKAQYYQVKVDGVDCKPKLLAVGLDHAFSKAYTGYVAYAQAKNETKGTCTTAASMAGGGHGDNPGSVAGKTMSGLSVGAIMKF